MSLSSKMRAMFGRKKPDLMLAHRFPEHAIGRGSYGDLELLSFGEGTKLQIGNYCSFARGAAIMLGGNHRVDWVTTYPFSAIDQHFTHLEGHPHSKGDVVIGNDVWVAREALILSGVTIGDGAVIGARAVVSRDVPAYTIVAGNPAVEIRKRFEPAVIDRLLSIKWWDWPDERIARAMPHLLSNDTQSFLDAAEQGRI